MADRTVSVNCSAIREALDERLSDFWDKAQATKHDHVCRAMQYERLKDDFNTKRGAMMGCDSPDVSVGRAGTNPLKVAVMELRKANSLINAQRVALRKNVDVADARDEMAIASRSLDLAVMFLMAEINDRD